MTTHPSSLDTSSLMDVHTVMSVIQNTFLVSVSDREGNIIYINQPFLDVCKYEREELLGKNHRVIKAPGIDPEIYIDLWRTISSGRVWRGELKNKAKDGAIFWLDTTICPQFDDHGTISSYLSFQVIITERKENEARLAKQGEDMQKAHLALLNVLEDIDREKKHAQSLSQDLKKYKLALDDTSDHVVITDAEGIVLYANKAVGEITGYAPEEVIGKKAGGKSLWGGHMPQSVYETLWTTIKVKKQPYVGEVNNRRKNGDYYTALATVSPVLGEKGDVEFFVGIERDITKEKQMMDERTRRELEYRRLYDRFIFATQSAHIGVWEWDIVTNGLVWDDQMYRLYGITRETFSGAFDAWEKGLHPEDREQAKKDLMDAVHGKKEFATTFRVMWPDGAIRYIEAHASVLKDAENKPVKMVGVNWDVTKEKEIEKTKSEFVSLASHQLRTPLTTIKWYTEMLLGKDIGQVNEKQSKYLKEIYEGSQRLVELVNALLNVSRIEMGTFSIDPEPTDIQRVLKDVIHEIQPLIDKKKLDVSVNDDRLPEILLDKGLMIIVFQNLLTNAVKYTPEGGHVTVSLRIIRESTRIGDHDIPVGNLLLCVTDTGYGIPEGEKDKIFTKLFRATNVQKHDTVGTGLGLYIIKRIIEHAQGAIWFSSAENKGTTFYVTISMAGMKKKEGTKRLDLDG